MTTTTLMVLAALCLVIIISLAAYAFYLWREVGRRRAFRKDEDRRAIENSLENLEMVASSLIQGQVEITEGAWRCKVLLEIIDPQLAERDSFRAFGEVFERTRHLHTHSARADLTPKARFKEDKERLAVEDEMREPVFEAARAALEFKKRWPESLN